MVTTDLEDIMFIGRRPDGTIYGSWTSKQPLDADHPGIEEVSDTHPDYLAYASRPFLSLESLVDARITQLEAQIVTLNTKTGIVDVAIQTG